MIAALLVSLIAGGVPVAAAAPQDPPIRIWLNNDRQYERGDRAKVQVETDDDGYLVVLHATPDGRLRVLFPIDPTDDNFVRGGHRYEIKGRGGREAFMVDVASGQGTVFAAVSRDPMRFDAFTQNDHWDARALNPNELRADPEPELTDVVQRMATGRYDYDILRYDVSYGESVSYYTPAVVRRAYYRDPFCDRYIFSYDCDPFYYGGRSGVAVSVIFGRPYRTLYDPFYYYDPYYYSPYYYGAGYRPYYRSPGYYYPSPYYYNPRPVYAGRLYTPYQFKAVNRTWSGAGTVDANRDRGLDDRRAGTGSAGYGPTRTSSPVVGYPSRPSASSQPGGSPSRDGYDGGAGRRRVDAARPASPTSPDAATAPRPEGRRSDVRDEQRARQDERMREQQRTRDDRPQPSIERGAREQPREQPRPQKVEAPRYEPRLEPRYEPRSEPRAEPRSEPRSQPRSEPRSAPAPREGGTYSRPSDGGGRRR